MSADVGTPRLCVTTKDVMIITGYRERASRKILAAIRSKYCKEKHQPVNLIEFSEYLGLPEEKVRMRLR